MQALVSLLEDVDRDVRRLARKGLECLGTTRQEAADKHLGQQEALRLLNPSAYQKEQKTQTQSQRRELEAQMSDSTKIAQILSSLRLLALSDP